MHSVYRRITCFLFRDSIRTTKSQTFTWHGGGHFANDLTGIIYWREKTLLSDLSKFLDLQSSCSLVECLFMSLCMYTPPKKKKKDTIIQFISVYIYIYNVCIDSLQVQLRRGVTPEGNTRSTMPFSNRLYQALTKPTNVVTSLPAILGYIIPFSGNIPQPLCLIQTKAP